MRETNTGREDLNLDREESLEALLCRIEQDTQNKKSFNWKAFTITVLVAITVVMVCVVFLFLRKGIVPSFVGMSGEEAKKLSEESHLKLVEEYEYSADIEAGFVISQDIKQGSKVRYKTEISIVISKGVEMVKIPSFSGLTLDEARNEADRIGISLDVVEEYSNNVEKGYIVSQKKKPGEEVEKGTCITLVLSGGVPMVIVPQFVGTSINDATIECSALELSLSTLTEYSDSVDKDIVIRQSIDKGSEVEKGSQLYLVVSLGKDTANKETGSANATIGSSGNASSYGGQGQQTEQTATTEEQFVIDDIEWGE